MRKVAIVGVEGSGKTVMLACLGELYSTPDEHGYFLQPKNFQTSSYVGDTIFRMRRGKWPMATADDAMQEINWKLCKRKSENQRPKELCEIAFLDFAGEVYRAAFGIREGKEESLSNEIKHLKDYVATADELIVLINMKDVINKGESNKRVQESIWITNSILDFALNHSGLLPPRACIAITQADSYADTIRMCGGARGVLAKYLPHIFNSYGWLDIYKVAAVDETEIDKDGNSRPKINFSPIGLQALMKWVIKGQDRWCLRRVAVLRGLGNRIVNLVKEIFIKNIIITRYKNNTKSLTGTVEVKDRDRVLFGVIFIIIPMLLILIEWGS